MTTPAQTTKPQRITRSFTGKVVSVKMNKTIVVLVERTVVHPRYHKRYTVSRRYPVHDEHGTSKVGEVVTFVECRPLSKTKRWRLATAT